MKIFIQSLEESRRLRGGFIIQDLGEVGLFVRESVVAEIEAAIQVQFEKCVKYHVYSHLLETFTKKGNEVN